jgi:hypothetical protein
MIRNISMNYQQITIELPALSDEAAAYIQNFIYRVMSAIDEHYYQQIKRYYRNESLNSFIEDHPPQENLGDPPF